MSIEEESWVFDSLVNFLQGPIWKLPVLNFIEEKSVVFDPDSYQSTLTDEKEGEFLKVHEEYKALVDYMLTNFMEDLQVTPEQVEEACRKQESSPSTESSVTKLALEQLLAAEDFNTFRRLMTRKNIDLQLQSLELLVAKYGVLSPSLRSDETSEDFTSEEDFIQVVLRYSDPDYIFRQQRELQRNNQSSDQLPHPHQIVKLYEKSDKSSTPSSSPTASKVQSSKSKKLSVKPKKSSSNLNAQSSQDLPSNSNLSSHFPPASSSSSFNSNTTTTSNTSLLGERLKEMDEAEERELLGAAKPLDYDYGVETKFSKMFDHETAKMVEVAPQQHRILSEVRKALEIPINDDDDTPFGLASEERQIGNQQQLNESNYSGGTDDEIDKRREYLKTQRDKIVALKKAEREKQLTAITAEQELSHANANAAGAGIEAGKKGGGSRPISARAAQLSLKSPPKVSLQPNDKNLAARRAIALRLKRELID